MNGLMPEQNALDILSAYFSAYGFQEVDRNFNYRGREMDMLMEGESCLMLIEYKMNCNNGKLMKKGKRQLRRCPADVYVLACSDRHGNIHIHVYSEKDPGFRETYLNGVNIIPAYHTLDELGVKRWAFP